MRIIGIDPGLRATGYAVIEFNGNNIEVLLTGEIKTMSREDLSFRLEKIFDGLDETCRKYAPAVMVIEKVYSHPSYPQTAVLLGHARGIVFLVAAKNNIKTVELAATTIKRSITSKGRAGKSQITKMVSYLAGDRKPIKSEHAADALAMAITYAYKA